MGGKGEQNHNNILKQDQQTVKYINRGANIFNKCFMNVTGEVNP